MTYFTLVLVSVVFCNDLENQQSFVTTEPQTPVEMCGAARSHGDGAPSPAQWCPVEQFEGDSGGGLVYVDRGRAAVFGARYIPSPHTSLFPVVTVTGTEALEVAVESKLVGVTSKGNEIYTLDVRVCDVSGTRALTRSEEVERSLAVMVDLFGRNGACADLTPLEVRVVAGCPPTKHLRVSRRTACRALHFSLEELQNNFTYTVPKDAYDPDYLSRPGSARQDLRLHYDMERLYCPLLVYHKQEWIPTLELWDAERLVEEVPGDFVMFEVNGLYTYEYLQSAGDARCLSQPQSWISMMRAQSRADPHTAWDRKNYRSCRDRRGPALVDPSAPYQVLRAGGGNRIRFLRSGMYIFKATVVEPGYSYCDLSATFSVWVYGSFPTPPLPTGEIQGVALAVSFALLLAAAATYLILARPAEDIHPPSAN